MVFGTVGFAFRGAVESQVENHHQRVRLRLFLEDAIKCESVM